MKRKLNPELIDIDNPEWTVAEAHASLPFSALSDTMQTKLARRARGVQLTPTKERITIRLSPTVVETFRATGAGWQTRIDSALQDWLKTHVL
ncbi:MAG TPA: BrnA antitoxin family protein [Methylotenera sp.]|nr:BrnA antitoxin family protein [Methylotenera sp.]HPH04472.1 BrnA antitoxin family protein [Methylotenera sp.]HPN00877.1 BrnA antitoxin family protein [Methylotenera sp.]